MIPWYAWLVIAAGCALPVVCAFLAPWFDDPAIDLATEVDLERFRAQADAILAEARALGLVPPGA